MTCGENIVIDADIMRAASSSVMPPASHSMMALEAIRNGAHKMAWSKPLLAEYKKHESRYSATWRANMFAQKRHQFWEHQDDPKLRKTLVAAQPEQATAQEIAVLKDAHLLELANATKGRIVSKDATAKGLFRRACPNLGAYRTTLWGNLTHSPDEVVRWIEDGCGDRQDFRLCPTVKKK